MLTPPADAPPPAHRANAPVVLAVVVAALYFGRDLFIPLALAMLLAFALSPAVRSLRRRGWPRGLAVALVVSASVLSLGVSGLFIGAEVRQMGQDLPSYQGHLIDKIQSLRTALRQPGALDALTRAVGRVGREISAAQTEAERPPGGAAVASTSTRPVQRVEIVDATPWPLGPVGSLLLKVADPLTTAGLVLVFVVLVLLDPADLRDRLMRLADAPVHRATDALDEAGHRVSRYLLSQLAVNVLYAVPLGLGLWFIGVPGAAVWAFVALLLRFVPYLGPLVASVFPLALSVVVAPGWAPFLWTAALIVALELLSNNVLEPWIYGQSTGLSALSLILAASFWALIWGPVGLVLSTPLTVCLLVLGRHVPQWAFLDVLLGSEPVLSAPTRLVQRLLAGSEDEAADLAEQAIREQGLAGFYAETALPALCLASDAHTTQASAEQRLAFASGMRRLLDDLEDEYPAETPVSPDAPRICVLAGRWELDQLAARVLAHRLSSEGLAARAEPPLDASAAAVDRLNLAEVDGLVLSYVSAEPWRHVRPLVRRLRRSAPHLRIVVALWALEPEAIGSLDLAASGVDGVGGPLEDVLAQVQKLSGPADGTSSYVEAGRPARDEARLEAMQASGILRPEHRPLMDRYAGRAAEVFDTRWGFVNVISRDWQLTHGEAGRSQHAGPAEPVPDLPRERSMCGHVVVSEEAMVVPDLRRDARFAGNPSLRERGIRFYAGAPLRTPDGQVLGALCVLDDKPGQFSDREMKLLVAMADDLMAELRAAGLSKEKETP